MKTRRNTLDTLELIRKKEEKNCSCMSSVSDLAPQAGIVDLFYGASSSYNCLICDGTTSMLRGTFLH